MKFSCPDCSQHIDTKETWAGRTINCPNCGHALVVPSPEKAASASLPPEEALPPDKTPLPTPDRNELSSTRTVAPPPVPFPAGALILKELYFTLLVAGALFGYATYRYHESPQQLFRRMFGGTRGSTVAAPTPPPDAFIWLLNHKNRLPREVTLLSPQSFPVVIKGNAAGTILVPAGTVVDVVAVEPGMILASYHGGETRLPQTATNLPELAKFAMQQPEPMLEPAKPKSARP